MSRAAHRAAVIVLVAIALAACGSDATSSPAAPESLNVQPQNSTLLVGPNRISVALLDAQQNPVTATQVTVDIVDSKGTAIGTRPLENISAEYGGIPVYVGTASFPVRGQFEYLVHAVAKAGATVSGHAFVTVSAHSPNVAVGDRVPAVHQAVLSDPGVAISMVDSGVPPDTWHDQTVAAALAAHQPMVLFFGEPGYCASKTCGPTVAILKQLCTQYCSRFSFQHIEDHFPAANDQVGKANPAFVAFGLPTEPWVYFVSSDGVVADHFEGPVTIDQLQSAAAGTLAGHVPAVSLQT